jgi:transketolase
MTRLDDIARLIRQRVVVMSAEAKVSHVGSALSVVDILVSLYFRVARIDPTRPEWPGRDRIILSKGHACAALYACLGERGFFAVERLKEYAANGSAMAEHPSLGTLPGVEATTGSLGHGLGIGLGIAWAAKTDGNSARVFVVLSDGELNEGSVWEAALWAPAHGLDNLTAIVDFNGLQATAPSRNVTALEPVADKWRAFGWQVKEADGHKIEELVKCLETPHVGRPLAIIAHTVKGKGVSFMENEIEWHYRPPSAEDLARALEELGGVGDEKRIHQDAR